MRRALRDMAQSWHLLLLHRQHTGESEQLQQVLGDSAGVPGREVVESSCGGEDAGAVTVIC